MKSIPDGKWSMIVCRKMREFSPLLLIIWLYCDAVVMFHSRLNCKIALVMKMVKRDTNNIPIISSGAGISQDAPTTIWQIYLQDSVCPLALCADKETKAARKKLPGIHTEESGAVEDMAINIRSPKLFAEQRRQCTSRAIQRTLHSIGSRIIFREVVKDLVKTVQNRRKNDLRFLLICDN